MDQPGAGRETTTVFCIRPRCGGGPVKAEADTPIEDGVGGGAVFAFKVGFRFADT
jgi:hypothetical protein